MIKCKDLVLCAALCINHLLLFPGNFLVIMIEILTMSPNEVRFKIGRRKVKRCTSRAPLVPLSCPSRAPLVPLSCPSRAPLVHLSCTSRAPLVHLLCTYGANVPVSQPCPNRVKMKNTVSPLVPTNAPLLPLSCPSRAPLVHLSCPSRAPLVHLWCHCTRVPIVSWSPRVHHGCVRVVLEGQSLAL